MTRLKIIKQTTNYRETDDILFCRIKKNEFSGLIKDRLIILFDYTLFSFNTKLIKIILLYG